MIRNASICGTLNAPLIQAFSGNTFSDFRHSSDEEIQHGFADAKVCEHYSKNLRPSDNLPKIVASLLFL